jgi:hypothetical protein
MYPDDTLLKRREDINFCIKMGRKFTLNYLAYVDDFLVKQDTEDWLQKSIFKQRRTGNK